MIEFSTVRSDVDRGLAWLGVEPVGRGELRLVNQDYGEHAVRVLANADQRCGAEQLWADVVSAFVAAFGALTVVSVRRARGRPSPTVDVGRVLDDALLIPLPRPPARRRPLVMSTRDGHLAVLETPGSAERAAAFCGRMPSTDAATWLDVADKVSGLTSVDAVAGLQAWQVLAAALDDVGGTRSPVRVEYGQATSRVHGIDRMIELGGLWAAPYAARLAGEATGTEVVKIEDPTRPDGLRNGSRGLFEHLNQGKRFWTADLRVPEVRNKVFGLGESTVVIENFTERVLGNLRTPPSELIDNGTSLISLRTSLQRPDFRTLGPLVELAAGWGLRSEADGRPDVAPLPFTDALCGVWGATAAAAVIDAPPQRITIGQEELCAAVRARREAPMR